MMNQKDRNMLLNSSPAMSLSR